MRKILLAAVLVLALAGALALFNRFTPRVAAQSGEPPPQTETQGDSSRTVSGVSPSTLTGFTISNPYCYQPDPTRNECSINLNYVQFTTDGNSPYLNYVTVQVDGKIRLRSQVFFENSISYYYNMAPEGFKVACGTPNQGGYGPAYGKGYNLEIGGYNTSETYMAIGYTTVKCPAFAP